MGETHGMNTFKIAAGLRPHCGRVLRGGESSEAVSRVE